MPTNYRPTPASALVISPDPLGAALIGAALELIGLRPVFPRENEPVRDTLRRVRPSHVLIDCDDPAALNESVLGPAMMTGARIFLFGAETRVRMRRHVAFKFQVGLIMLPQDAERLAAILLSPAERTPAGGTA